MIIGDFSVSRPSAPLAPADSDLIQPEFWAIPQDGDPFVLAEVGDFDIAGIAGSRGTLSLSVPTHTVLHDLLLAHTVDADADLEVEVRLFGGQARSLRGFLTSSQGDEVAESGTRQFSGVLMGQRVYETVLYPRADDPKGETHFAAKNAGQIVLTLMQTAKARGAVVDIDTSTFSTATDSNGQAWTTNTTVTLSPGSTYGELLEEFEELGLCEWEVTGFRELKLFVPGTRGTDHTVGANPTVLHRGRDLVDAPRSHDVRDSVTTLLTAGKEGLYHSETDAEAQARRGRRIEGYATSGQIDNVAALQGYTQNKLAAMAPGAMELSHGLVCNGSAGGPVPFLDVNLGDWIWSATGRGTGPERLRVQQVSISRRSGELQAQAVVGTLSMSMIVALNRRLARLERGTTVVGTTLTDEAAAGEDTTPPAAPTGLVATSIAYQDTAAGETYAVVTVGWEAVTTDARADLSPAAQAAQLILDRIESGAVILEDWSWTGAPQLVTDHNDALLDEFGEDWDDPSRTSWLQDYINTAEAAISDPVYTDDVAGYRVRYAYVGINQIGGIPSSDPFEGDVLSYIMATPDTGTSATSYAFGGVGAGADIRVQVAAFDRSGNQSVWSNPLTFTTETDNLPPPAPSQPVVTIWFRTMDIHWDGLTGEGVPMSEAAPDFDHLAMIVSQQASFTAPPVTGEPSVFDPDLTGPQWVVNISGPGTWNIPGLPVGVSWYVQFVAVDRAGNVSTESPITGPLTAARLVQIDIGPDAIGRAQIIDGEIVRAKIEDLAVNSAKIEELDVGLIRTGTMTATVTLSGQIRTAITGARTEIDPSGIRLFNAANQTTVRFASADGSALITGVFQTALSGERLRMFSDGSLEFYNVAGNNPSKISNFGNDVVWRGPLDPNGRSGRFNVNVLGCGMNYSSESEIPNNLRAEIAVFDRRVRLTSPLIHFQANGKLSNADGTARRVQFSTTNSSGVDIGGSFVHYRVDSNGFGGFGGNGGGIKFQAGQILITTEDLNSFSAVRASDFVTASSVEIKTDIRPLRDVLGMRAVDVAQQVRPVAFSYRAGAASAGRHIGLTVEDIGPLAPDLVDGWDRPARERALSPMGVATLALGAASDNADDIADLRRRLTALEST